MAPSFRTLNKNDVKISELVGLETYKGLYAIYPDLYSYISDPLVPTNYYTTLVQGVIANSGMNKSDAGNVIYETLSKIVNDETPESQNLILVSPLIDSSYTIKNLNYTTWENVIWISIVVLLSFWIIWYLFEIGFWSYLFNSIDGIACYDCRSIFDMIDF